MIKYIPINILVITIIIISTYRYFYFNWHDFITISEWFFKIQQKKRNIMKEMRKIRTSEKNWFEKAIECFSEKISFEFIDDVNIGVSSDDLSSAINLIKKVTKTKTVKWQDIISILTGLGMSSVGVWMIAIAIADPEPTSTLWILLAGGVILTMTGGMSILYALGQKWSVKTTNGNSTIIVEPK
ncbi:hypothetical protein KKC74_08600 [bacterium]|nr:hypothetical protein [bacterium]MBU1064849.1 hypothetical protein [bacterium]MBU1872116.1 hypothetical protein [bacterium]